MRAAVQQTYTLFQSQSMSLISGKLTDSKNYIAYVNNMKWMHEMVRFSQDP